MLSLNQTLDICILHFVEHVELANQCKLNPKCCSVSSVILCIKCMLENKIIPIQ